MDDIKIKACSPDNGVQLAQLVAVFRDSYGDQFPFPAVYDAEYWARSIGSRFLSVVASRKHRVLAHIAARPESRDSRVVQLCFPACSAEIRERAVEVTRAAWELLSRVAARQQWSAIYFASFSDIDLMQRISVEALNATTTAILPGYIPMQNPRCARTDHRSSREGGRSHVIVGQRLLEHSTPNMAPLFIPSQHIEMCKHLFASLGISGIAARLERSHEEERPMIQADAPAIQSRIFKDWGSAQFVVRPSLLSGFQDSLFELSRVGDAHSFVFVDARDAGCPEYCEFLEENGFVFSGVLPNLYGTESVAYSRAWDGALDPESFLCSTAKSLARYMVEHDTQRTPISSPLAPRNQTKYVAARS